MKKLLLSFALASLFAGANAQTLFYEDFDGIPGPTAGGAGTYVFPSGWFLRNVDNRTPNSQTAYVNEAWERREDFANNVGDSAAFSTSYYSPVGAADDWMWTPLIGPLPANAVLSWNAVTYDPLYPDGYEVRIMTSSQGPPTGGTGAIGNQLTNSTQLFTIAAENTTWTARSVSLNAYTGQSVYIGFRNTSNDKFILVIDDIKVEVQTNYDAQVLSATTSTEYTQVPLNQQPSFPLAATIRNNGINAVTNVTLTANVYDQGNNLVHTTTAAPLASLGAGATSSLQTLPSPFVPTLTGNYRIEYSVAIAETDQVTANNTLIADSVMITDSVYARDRGAITGSIGIGAGNGGFLGSKFIVTDTAKLSSVSIYLNGQPAGSKVGVQVINYTNNMPGTTVLYADTDSLAAAVTGWHTFVLSTPMSMLPDTYMVNAVEVDSTLTLGQTTNKFYNNTFWVNWPTTPMGGWAGVEAFAPQFSKAFMIRANLHDRCYYKQQVSAAAAQGTFCGSGTDTLVASGTATYLWDTGSNNDSIVVTPITTTTYTVVGADAEACYDTAMVTVTVNSLPAVTATASVDTLCDGEPVTLSGAGALTYNWTGGVTDGVAFNPSATQTYTVTGIDANACSDTATIEVVVNLCLGMEDISSPLFTAYPNPNKGVFTVEAMQPVTLTVYNAQGEEAGSYNVAAGRHQVDLSAQQSGIYFVRAVNQDGQWQLIKIIRE